MFKLVSVFALFTVVSCLPQYYNPYQPVSPYYRSYAYNPQSVVSVRPPILPLVAGTAPIVPTYNVARSYAQYGSSAEAAAPILRQDQDVNVDGSYRYAYETGNGIAAEQVGGLKAIGNSAGNVAQGSYRYTSPEGKVVSVSYIADENGYRAEGDAIPKPLPAIARTLQPQYVQQPQYVRPLQYVQQPQYVRPLQYVQQPQYVRPLQYVQQPQYVRPLQYVQQPQFVQQPQYIQRYYK